ncbi:hypothetical protein ACVWXM_009687 [Bradyrhizobium sp. GM7.3]
MNRLEASRSHYLRHAPYPELTPPSVRRSGAAWPASPRRADRFLPDPGVDRDSKVAGVPESPQLSMQAISAGIGFVAKTYLPVTLPSFFAGLWI